MKNKNTAFCDSHKNHCFDLICSSENKSKNISFFTSPQAPKTGHLHFHTILYFYMLVSSPSFKIASRYAQWPLIEFHCSSISFVICLTSESKKISFLVCFYLNLCICAPPIFYSIFSINVIKKIIFLSYLLKLYT